MNRRNEFLGTSPGCSGCALRALCLPAGLDPGLLSGPALHKLRLQKGTFLYRAGDPLRHVYAIRAGFLKTRVLLANGAEQVAGFHMQGEAVGLEGIGSGASPCDAVALEDSEICGMPFTSVDELCAALPSVSRHVRGMLGEEIACSRTARMILSGTRGEQRLAAFLLDLSQRYAARGYAAQEFVLRMKREEIGSYLGLQIETVSRLFSQLQQRRIVEVRRKRVRIIDPARLSELALRPAHAAAESAGPAELACPWHRS